MLFTVLTTLWESPASSRRGAHKIRTWTLFLSRTKSLPTQIGLEDRADMKNMFTLLCSLP